MQNKYSVVIHVTSREELAADPWAKAAERRGLEHHTRWEVRGGLPEVSSKVSRLSTRQSTISWLTSNTAFTAVLSSVFSSCSRSCSNHSYSLQDPTCSHQNMTSSPLHTGAIGLTTAVICWTLRSKASLWSAPVGGTVNHSSRNTLLTSCWNTMVVPFTQWPSLHT